MVEKYKVLESRRLVDLKQKNGDIIVSVGFHCPA